MMDLKALIRGSLANYSSVLEKTPGGLNMAYPTCGRGFPGVQKAPQSEMGNST